MVYAPPARHLLRARELVDARYFDGIGVEDMAQAAGLSRAHFSREFRRAFGETPRAYLLTRRLERAAGLLRTTDRSVTDPPQIAAVVSIDQYERWLVGDRVAAEDYLALLPPGPDVDQAACDIVYGEFLLREQLGEHPSLQEYQGRFPGQAALLARQVDLHQALASEAPEEPLSAAHLSVPKPRTAGRSRARRSWPTACCT